IDDELCGITNLVPQVDVVGVAGSEDAQNSIGQRDLVLCRADRRAQRLWVQREALLDRSKQQFAVRFFELDILVGLIVQVSNLYRPTNRAVGAPELGVFSAWRDEKERRLIDHRRSPDPSRQGHLGLQ